MDEVTGLSLNATQYPMSARDALTYTATLPLPYNSVVKYRYVRRGASQVLEDTSLGTAIRYRMQYVVGPSEVQDIIADWGDKSYTRPNWNDPGAGIQCGYGFAIAKHARQRGRCAIHHRFCRAF